MVEPPVNILDGDTEVTNHSSVSELATPTRRSERNATKYSHMQAKKKQVSFSDDAILKSVKQRHAILSDETTRNKKYNPNVVHNVRRN